MADPKLPTNPDTANAPPDVRVDVLDAARAWVAEYDRWLEEIEARGPDGLHPMSDRQARAYVQRCRGIAARDLVPSLIVEILLLRSLATRTTGRTWPEASASAGDGDAAEIGPPF